MGRKTMKEEDDDGVEEEGSMETIKFRMVSKTLLLMKASDGVNPLNPLVKQKSILTSKKPKQRSDVDIWEMYRLDFVLSLYHDEELGPYVPGVNIEAAGLQSAKVEKLGTKWTAAVRVIEDKLELEYEGPRDIDKLWEARETFVDLRPGKLRGTSSIMICRPLFRKWSLGGTLLYDTGIIDRVDVIRCLLRIGAIGICDYHKRYGKSDVTVQDGG